MKVTYHINEYDRDGDVWSEGVFIHFDKNTIIKVGPLSDLERLITDLQKCKEEIAENYNL